MIFIDIIISMLYCASYIIFQSGKISIKNPSFIKMPIVLEICVIPQSGQNEFLFDENEILKFYLKSAPEKGKANKELIETLSKILKIPQNKFTIVFGAMSRKKRIKIDTELTKEMILEKLYRNITRK